MVRITTVERARTYIEQHPGCTSHEVAAHLGMRVESVRKMLHRDIVRGNVDRDVIGNVSHYWLEGRHKVRAPAGAMEDIIRQILSDGKARTCAQLMDISGKQHRSQVWQTLQRMEARLQVKATVYGVPIRWYLPDEMR